MQFFDKIKIINKPFTQTKWLGISLDELNIKLNSQNLPKKKFYKKFYSKLFEKYKSFESFPKDFLEIKKKTAEYILKITFDNQRILSFGSGVGLVEEILNNLNPSLRLYIFDISDKSNILIKKNFRTIHLKKRINKKFNLIYLCQVLYAIPFSDCIKLIKKLSRHLTPDGKILLINTSIFDSENGVIHIKNVILNILKKLTIPIYKKFFPLQNRKKKQFWGWLRNNETYFEISKRANMKIDKCYSAAHQSFILLSK
jgi:ubiquinone/menaquinone biosynthesis C-methylase UbiE